MNTKKIGEFLKALRKAKGLTQEMVASELFVSPKTISRWESGLGIPDINIISSVAEFYGVTVDEILKGEKGKNNSLKEETLVISNKKKERLLVNNIIDKYNKYFLASLIILGVAIVLGIIIGFLTTTLIFYFLSILGIAVGAIIIFIANKDIKRVDDDEEVVNEALGKALKIVKQRNLLFTDILIGCICLVFVCMLILEKINVFYTVMTILCIVGSYLILRFALSKENCNLNNALFYVLLIIGIVSICVSCTYEITKLSNFANSYTKIRFFPIVYFAQGYKVTYRVISVFMLIIGLTLMAIFSIKKRIISYFIGYVLSICAGMIPYLDYKGYQDYIIDLTPSVIGVCLIIIEIALIIYFIYNHCKEKKEVK